MVRAIPWQCDMWNYMMLDEHVGYTVPNESRGYTVIRPGEAISCDRCFVRVPLNVCCITNNFQNNKQIA